jgi:2-polyprenyl-3-methyl-5-hydroxy-6-metoxy-1,4-benzoquinol methylase
MMLITHGYRQQNQIMHAKGNYGVSGGKWAFDVDALMHKLDAKSMLDYGCGRGFLREELLANYDVTYAIREYDPAIAGKDGIPGKADVVVCGDVLEHVEPICLDSVLDHIKRLAQKAAFLVVATRPAVKHLPDGRNAHLIVEPMSWWVKPISERWRIDLLRELVGEFYCVCMPP